MPNAPTLGALDAAAFVQNAAQYAVRGNYMGTLVFQRAGTMDVYRIAHLNDNGVERERLLMLDGTPKEIVREGDRTEMFLPESKLVKIHAQQDRAFPAISPAHVNALLNFYTVSDLGLDRVAGHLARGVAFTPRDSLRFAQQWWSELRTGLPVRARILNDQGDVIEQVSFTDLHLDSRVSRHHLRSIYANKANDWRVEMVPAPGNLVTDTGWVARELPPGFWKVREGVRSLAGPGTKVPHLLFSDGVATISVFIEPGGQGEPVGMVSKGAVNLYRRQTQDSVVTALGQATPQALKAIADSLIKK
jgi:sigma-E factor negative regulatory protein RseB